MENRDAVINEYFRLRILLNRTNLIRDQKTEIDLLAIKKGPSDYALVVTLTGIANPKYIELCTKAAGNLWKPMNFSGLIHFEDFCVEFLRQNLSRYFSLDELNMTVTKLKTELKNLGIA